MQGFISSVGNIESGGQGGATDTFVKLIVDLTNITPTTETVNSKQYNKFTFTKTDLTVKTVNPLGDEETEAIDDALVYNLFPISNNNDDKGINITYDGTTFSGYVLAQESTLTTVSFMFTYYIAINQTSVAWKNYVDMVSSSSGGSSLPLRRIRKQYTSATGFPTSYISEFFVKLPQNVQTISDLKNYIINNGAYTENKSPVSTEYSVQTAYIPCCFAQHASSQYSVDFGICLFVSRTSIYTSNVSENNDWKSWDESAIKINYIRASSVNISSVTIDNTWEII